MSFCADQTPRTVLEMLGPHVKQAAADPSGHARIAVGHPGGTGLETRSDVLDPVLAVVDGVENRQHRVTGHAEHVLDSLLDQRVDDRFRSRPTVGRDHHDQAPPGPDPGTATMCRVAERYPSGFDQTSDESWFRIPSPPLPTRFPHRPNRPGRVPGLGNCAAAQPGLHANRFLSACMVILSSPGMTVEATVPGAPAEAIQAVRRGADRYRPRIAPGLPAGSVADCLAFR